MKPAPVSKRRTLCLLCASSRLDIVLPLAPTPIADDFVYKNRLGEVQAYFPLDVALCLDCGHLQLLDAVNPDLLFGSYIYVSTSSPGLVDHFKKAAQRLRDLVQPGEDAFAFDIGSNDGTLLRALKEQGFRVLGVDPAKETAQRATESGVETIPAYFTSELARRIRKERGAAALITANNVFAHSETLPDMADGVAALLADDGLFVFEVAYLVDMLEQFVFDSVYHEHLGYHSLKPLASFLKKHGLELIDAERVAQKGGSLRCTAQKAGGSRPVSERVDDLSQRETEMGLAKPAVFLEYAATILRRKAELEEALSPLQAQGKTVAGYGASATVTTLLHHFDLGKKIAYLFDDNEIKHGRYSPGHHIPVLPSEQLYVKKPGAVVILAWRFAGMIIKKHKRYLDEGGIFIVPLPKLEIFGDHHG